MDSPETNQSYTKRDIEEGSVGNSDRAGNDEELDGTERRHNTSKSRRSGNGEELDGWDGSGRRKILGDRTYTRKRSSGSSTGGSDEDEYDKRKSSRPKLVNKKAEESTLEKLSNWYQDGELEGRHVSGVKYGNRGQGQLVEADRNLSRETTSKVSDHEGFHTRSRVREEKSSHDGVYEKGVDKESRSSERREINREKDRGSSEMRRNTRNISEESHALRKAEGHRAEKNERSGKGSGSKRHNSRERSTHAMLETSETKSRGLEANSDRGKSYSQEERKADLDKPKGGSRSDAIEEDTKASPLSCDDRSGGEKSEKYREQRITSQNAAEIQKSSNPEVDQNMWTEEKNGSGVGHPRRSETPDRSGRYLDDVARSQEYDRSGSLKRKEVDKDGYRDDRLKDVDNNLSDRNRDREGSRDNWKRRQPFGIDKGGDMDYEHGRDWDVMRRVRDRTDNERPLGRSGNRKDGRGEAVKASLKYGNSTDVIEIQPKPLDYGREDVGFAFGKRNDVQQPDSKAATNDEWAYPGDNSARTGAHGSAPTTDNSKEKYMSEGAIVQDQHAWRDKVDTQGGRSGGQKIPISNCSSIGPSSCSLSLPPYGIQDLGSFGWAVHQQQGIKGGRGGRTSRVRPSGRDNQQVSIPVSLMESPFGPLGMPQHGLMQPLNPSMSPAPGPSVPHGLLFPPFSPPVWPGAHGVDMNLLPVSLGVSSMPPGQRFPPNMGNPSTLAMYFNQPGLGRGPPSNASGPGFNSLVTVGQGQSHEKGSRGWIPSKSGGLAGKAPSRGEQNDYSQNFVDTGMRPQNFIRELELTNVEDYPRLRELIQKKDEIVDKAASPPMYYKCDLHEFEMSPEFFGTKFDVILVDPPWEEYVHRAPGVDHMEYWKFEEIMNLKIEAIADTPSFIFLWVGDSVGLEQGRQCLKKWGFRRCEDICWVKTNKHTVTPALRHDSHTLFQHSKEHCLMGIRGTVRRSTDGHIIHANIDTDVIISEEPPYGSTAKPDEIYRIIEHFALGRRRIELFGEDHNIRTGWLTVGRGLSSSNFNAEAYCRSFADREGKVWHGGGGRNPPPDAPHLVQTTPEIESLRPKSPMKNQQQLQTQQSTTISLTANCGSKRPTGNSPQNSAAFNINQEASSDRSAAWPSPIDAFKGRDAGNIGPPGDNVFDMHGYNMPHVPPNTEYVDFETQRAMNFY